MEFRENFKEGEVINLPEWLIGVASIPEVQMTPQKIFDVVVKSFRKQPNMCRVGRSIRYKFQEDKCLVGHLIDDYEPTMEGIEVRKLIKQFPMPKWFVENIDMIEDFQRIHDNEDNWSDGRIELILMLYAQEKGFKYDSM